MTDLDRLIQIAVRDQQYQLERYIQSFREHYQITMEDLVRDYVLEEVDTVEQDLSQNEYRIVSTTRLRLKTPEEKAYGVPGQGTSGSSAEVGSGEGD
jgi:hypothetical protein